MCFFLGDLVMPGVTHGCTGFELNLEDFLFFRERHIIHVGYFIYGCGVGLLWVRIGQNMIPGEMVNQLFESSDGGWFNYSRGWWIRTQVHKPIDIQFKASCVLALNRIITLAPDGVISRAVNVKFDVDVKNSSTSNFSRRCFFALLYYCIF